MNSDAVMAEARGAAERLAIVAEKPAHLIRWGEGDRLDLQSVLAALPPPSTGGADRDEIAHDLEQAWQVLPVDNARAVEARSIIRSAILKLKENGLSREGLGGLARSLPSGDAQERSPVPLISDGWRVKDLADGWIHFPTGEEALAEVAAMGGALIEPALPNTGGEID